MKLGKVSIRWRRRAGRFWTFQGLSVLTIPYHPHFRFELYAQPLADLLADERHELQSLSGRAAAEVDEVVGVDGRDLYPPHPRPFEAGRLDDAAGEIARGTFKGRAATRPVRGAVHPLRPELLYAGLELLRVARRQGVAGAQDDPVGVVVQDAAAVGELEVLVAHPECLAVPVDIGPSQDLLRLAFVGAGVHVHGAPDGAGYAGRELETPQAARGGRVGEGRVENPGLGAHALALNLDPPEGLGEPDSEAPDAAVAHEHVRPAAEHRDRDAVLAGL